MNTNNRTRRNTQLCPDRTTHAAMRMANLTLNLRFDTKYSYVLKQ